MTGCGSRFFAKFSSNLLSTVTQAEWCRQVTPNSCTPTFLSETLAIRAVRSWLFYVDNKYENVI